MLRMNSLSVLRARYRCFLPHKVFQCQILKLQTVGSKHHRANKGVQAIELGLSIFQPLGIGVLLKGLEQLVDFDGHRRQTFGNDAKQVFVGIVVGVQLKRFDDGLPQACCGMLARHDGVAALTAGQRIGDTQVFLQDLTVCSHAFLLLNRQGKKRFQQV